MFFVRRSKTDPSEWIVWGPMGDPEFVGRFSGHSTARAAWKEAQWRQDSRKKS